MDHALLPIIKRIIDDYGDDFFGNMARANAVLLDLAPNMARERILIRNFIELNGYKTLRGAGDNYRLVKNRLIKSLTDTFCVERAAALWVANLFACALGFEDAAAPITAWGAESESVTHPGARSSVAIGKSHTVAVSADGSVFSHGSNDHFQCDVGNWKDIVAVAAGDTHTVGLCENGRVLAAGSNANDQCDVGHLNGIASVYAFGNDTVCVRTDGSAVAAGKSRFDL
ncbi:MAG: hypothetical protein FWF03_05405 [Defluviitaleaceae bacterium]|nr:hypothetical protein [Defluviitaleaceae bacterium]